MTEPLPYLILSTSPDRESAERIAGALVTERLAACVNIVPGIRSVYHWKGTLQSSEEHLLIIKAPSGHYATIQKRLLELHPYELPEIVAVPIAEGLPAYLSWLSTRD